MTSPTYADAIASQTAQQVRDTLLLPALATAGSTVGGAPTSSPDRGIVEAEATFLAMEQQLRAGVALSISATTALQAGDSWVVAAATWYQVPSNQGPGNTPGGIGPFVATTALWSIPLVCAPTAAPITLVPGQILQAQAQGGQVFNLAIPAGAQPIVLNAGNSYKATVPLLARLPGTAAGNVTPGQITSLITAPAGLSVDLSSTQVLTTAARDQESSAALLVRCYGRWGTIGAGWTSQAFDFLIPSFASDVTRWGVDDANPFGPGSVGVWLATAAGPASGPSSAPGTDSFAVYQGLAGLAVKPLGSGPLVVQPATTVALSITAVLVTDGTNPNLVQNATDAVSAFANALIGAYSVTGSMIVALLQGGAFVGDFEVPIGSTGTKKVTLNIPGFGGMASFQTFTTSPALAPALDLSAGQILALTFAISTVGI